MFARFTGLSSSLALVVFAVACGSSSGGSGSPATGDASSASGGSVSATPGSEGGPCYPNSTCNQGLTCASDLCVKFAGSGGAGNGTGGTPGLGGAADAGGAVSSGGATNSGGADASVGSGGTTGDADAGATGGTLGGKGGATPDASVGGGGTESGGSAGTGGFDAGSNGGTASGGTSGSGGVSGSGGATGDGSAVGTLGGPCSATGAHACAGHDQQQQLVCAGTWQGNGLCTNGNNCDTTPGSTAGTCQPIVAECSGKSPKDVVCQGMDRVTCGADRVTVAPIDTCQAGTQSCASGACVTCTAGTANCDGNAADCETDLNSTATCGTTCANKVACSTANGAASCTAGACGISCNGGYADCTPGNDGCETNLNSAATCGTSCGTRAVCAYPTPLCNAGACAPPASCRGLAANCGPSSNESCCTSPVVSGGTFFRSYDAVYFTDKSYPATVSNFRLDKYEITVGRFRKFVAAYSQSMIAAGAGKNPNNAADSGWDTAWNTSLPANAAALQTAVKCGLAPTWTDTPGSNEDLPMTCMTWFEANAFCIWDDGRLPTEAEWDYAAAGGSEQRVYPWSSPASSTTIDCSYANTAAASACVPPSGGANNVGSESPKGNGKYGQADLAGNVSEWVNDSYSTYTNPCTDCTVQPGIFPVFRGGASSLNAYPHATASNRSETDPKLRGGDRGARCARNP